MVSAQVQKQGLVLVQGQGPSRSPVCSSPLSGLASAKSASCKMTRTNPSLLARSLSLSSMLKTPMTVICEAHAGQVTSPSWMQSAPRHLRHARAPSAPPNPKWKAAQLLGLQVGLYRMVDLRCLARKVLYMRCRLEWTLLYPMSVTPHRVRVPFLLRIIRSTSSEHKSCPCSRTPFTCSSIA